MAVDADTPTPISMTRIIATSTSEVRFRRLPDMALQADQLVRGISRTRTRAITGPSWPVDMIFQWAHFGYNSAVTA